MKNRNFFAWHLGYLVVIACLLGSILRQSRHDSTLRQLFSTSLPVALRLAKQDEKHHFLKIQGATQAYPIASMRELYQKAVQADSLRLQFEELLDTLPEAKGGSGTRDKDKTIKAPLSAQRIGVLWNEGVAMQQKYRELGGADLGTDSVRVSPFPLHSPNNLEDLRQYLQSANVEETMLVLSTFRLHAVLAEGVLLKHLGQKFSWDPPTFDATLKDFR